MPSPTLRTVRTLALASVVATSTLLSLLVAAPADAVEPPTTATQAVDAPLRSTTALPFTWYGVDDAAAGRSLWFGTGTAGMTVEFRDGFEPSDPLIGTTVVDDDGTWVFQVDAVPSGVITFVHGRDVVTHAFVQRPSGIDPTVDALEDVVGPRPTLRGTAETGSTLTITDVLPTQTQRRLRVPVRPDGTWEWTPPAVLAAGRHRLAVEQTNALGLMTSTLVEFTVREGEPDPVAPIAITSPADGSRLQSGDVVFTGTGEPRATVVLTAGDGTEVARTGVGADGRWSVAATRSFAAGPHTVDAVQTPRR